MSSKYSGETASASASWLWTVCVFILGIFLGPFISGMLLNWKSSLERKFHALMGYPPSSHPSQLGHQNTASAHPMDSGNIQDKALGQEDTASTRPLDSNIIEGSLLRQEYSASAHPMDSGNIQDKALGQEDTASTHTLDSNIMEGSLVSREDSASAHPMDSDNIQDKPVGPEDTGSTHPLDSNIIVGSLLSQQDSASAHPMDSDNFQTRPSSQPVYRYDVFLSFSGIDARNDFIDHLHERLEGKCIFTFKDDERLETGGSISLQLMKAIELSRLAIVVFSSHYADSTWCLDEMAAIADRRRKLEQIVIPVFYNVDPSNVRKQEGAYEDAFVSLTERFRDDPGKVQRWKKDMTYLADLCGDDVRYKRQTLALDKIVQAVIDKLDHQFSADISGLVGITPRIEELKRRLKFNSEDDDFRILGIWGMSGIGKTDLAKVLYDKISYQFNACCFINNVSENYRKRGRGYATEVQEGILRQTVQEKNLKRRAPTDITGILQLRLCNEELPRKVLMVLDDVDDEMQWDALAINPKSLARGSRVIITTRSEHFLNVIGAKIYEVPLLDYNDALELFLRKAFTSDRPSSISDVTPKILEYAQSLPSAIIKLGYFFNSRKERYWEQALEIWRKYPDEKFMNTLQTTSYDELNPNEKEIFLDIACFFGGKRMKYVEHILDSCSRTSPHVTIQQIREKSLITIRNQEIHMHKILQELGKKIVRGENLEEPKYWKRLWHVEDFEKVLKSDMEANEVQAIVLDDDISKYSHLRIEMKDLKLLILHQKNSSENLNFLLKKLQYLFWHGYPFSSLPLSTWFDLVELNLPNSSIQRPWEDGKTSIPNLKRLDLRNSKNLTKTPDFECCPRLERLDLTGCTNLTHVHESIRLLTELDYLSLRDCSSLAILDLGSTNCKLSSLRILHLSGCTNLKNTPDFTRLSNLEYLDLERCTNLSTVHESIGALAALKFLSLRGCTNLVDIPNNVNNMTSLLIQDLSGCMKLVNLPQRWKVMSSSCLESLIFLDLGFNELKGTLDAIGELRFLEGLNQRKKFSFSSVHDNIEWFSRLAYLNLAHCRELVRFPELPFDSLRQVKGILERYPHLSIISQDYIFSAATMNGT